MTRPIGRRSFVDGAAAATLAAPALLAAVNTRVPRFMPAAMPDRLARRFDGLALGHPEALDRAAGQRLRYTAPEATFRMAQPRGWT